MEQGHEHPHGEEVCDRCIGPAAVIERTADLISRGKWSITGVIGYPGFAYTTGLWELFEHPEVVIVGLPYQVAGHILNDLGHMVGTGHAYADGMKVLGLTRDYPTLFREVAKPYERLRDTLGYPGVSIMYYGHADFPYLQALFPDIAGNFPGAPNFNPAMRELEPLL